MIPTQAAIAQQLGISQATVSMALRGTGKMAKETRDRILKEAIQLGYRHNSSAQAIRSGQFGSISLLLSTVYQHSFLPVELIPGIIAGLRRHSTQLTLIGSPDQELLDEEFVHEALRRWSSDGLLINYTHNFPNRMVDLIHSYRVPSVWMNSKLESDSIYPDDFGATSLATRTLCELGHRHIGYIDLTRSSHYSATDRYDGYAETLHAHRLRPHPLTCRIPRPDRYEAIKSWLSSSDRPTAVVTYEDREAIPLFVSAVHLGIRVPEDLSIVTIHDFPADSAGIAFTTVQNDFYTLGMDAVKMIMQKVKSPTKTIASKKISPKWLDGATIAPPAANGKKARKLRGAAAAVVKRKT